MIQKFFLQRGQSLLEAVFAIGILLMVAFAILTFAIASLSGQKASELQVRANNLAREAIEVVRNIRDSNWLAGNAWDLGLAGNIVNFDPSSTNEKWEILDAGAAGLSTLLYLDASEGIYTHNPIDPGSQANQPTIFFRQVVLQAICKLPGSEETIEDNCQSGEEKIGVKVSSMVSWSERGSNRSVKIDDYLYAWK